MRRWLLTFLVLLAWVVPQSAWATTTTTSSTSTSTTTSTSTSVTTLPMNHARGPVAVMQECTALCQTGVAADGTAGGRYLAFNSDGAAVLSWTGTAAGTFSFKVQQCIEESPQTCDKLVLWRDVGSACSSSPCAITAITSPNGWYRTNVTSCTGCIYRTVFRAERHRSGGF